MRSALSITATLSWGNEVIHLMVAKTLPGFLSNPTTCSILTNALGQKLVNGVAVTSMIHDAGYVRAITTPFNLSFLGIKNQNNCNLGSTALTIIDEGHAKSTGDRLTGLDLTALTAFKSLEHMHGMPP